MKEKKHFISISFMTSYSFGAFIAIKIHDAYDHVTWSICPLMIYEFGSSIANECTKEQQ